MLMKKISLIALALLAACTTVHAGRVSKMVRAPQRLVNVTPVTTPATDITATGFTANWQSVPGASGYAVFCYEPITIEETGDYYVLNESFNLVNIGSTVEPVWDENFSCTLDGDYDFTFTPDWTVIGAAFAKGMVSGNVYTPYTDLTNDNGKYKLHINIVAQQGTKISVKSIGTTTQTQRKTTTQLGGEELVFEFTNGAHDTYIYIVDEGIEGDDEGEYINVLSWFDDIKISQHLTAGDTILRLVDINEAVEAPNHSCRFDNMKFLYGATDLCYDLYAAYVDEGDPDDWWDDEVDYSRYSALEYVQLPSVGVAETATDATECEIFDINGRRAGSDFDALAPGMYIVRQGNTTRKIMKH